MDRQQEAKGASMYHTLFCSRLHINIPYMFFLHLTIYDTMINLVSLKI